MFTGVCLPVLLCLLLYFPVLFGLSFVIARSSESLVKILYNYVI